MDADDLPGGVRLRAVQAAPVVAPVSQSLASRVTAAGALAGVSLIAAVVSYLHGLAVVQMVGARPPVAYLIPFLADLVILGASASLLDASRAGRRMPALSVLSLTVGIGATVAMNVAAGWHHGAGGRLVAAWPAVAFILALESLAGIVRRGRGAVAASAPATPDELAAPSFDEALRVLLTTGSRRVVADGLGVPKSRVDGWAYKLAGPAGTENVAGTVPPLNAVPATQLAALNGDGRG